MNYVSYDIISQIYRLLKTEIVLWLKISLVVDFMQRSPVFKKKTKPAFEGDSLKSSVH